MAGGPFFPSSVDYGTSGQLFPNYHVGGGGNAAATEEGHGVAAAADLSADRSFSFRFTMPDSLPTGTPTFVVRMLNGNTSGDLSIDPTGASVAVDEDPSAASLTAEGPNPTSRSTANSGSGNATFTLSAGDDDVYLEARWTMDAFAPVAGEVVVMQLRVDDGDTTVTAVSTLTAFILFVD